MSIPIPGTARHPAFWWAAFAVWFAVLYLLSSISGIGRTPPPVMISDKVAHVCYFTAGGTALACALGLGRRAPSKLLLFIACVAMAAAVGWFDEWHQSHTPGRDGNSVGDWVADVVGGALGAVAAMVLLPMLRKPAAPCSRPGTV